MERAGLPLDGLGAMFRQGMISLDFIESAGQSVFTPFGETTFAELSSETGIPLEVLSSMREAVGGLPPRPDDRVAQSEMALLPLVQFQDQLGFRHRAIEQGLRVYGDTMRRVAETEAEWFRSEILGPMYAKGMTDDQIGRFAAEISPRLSEVSAQALLGIYHAQQGHAWLANIIHGIGQGLESAGLHTAQQTVPAMCFLDITGYTLLTSEQGDQVAADTAERLRRIVERRAIEHGGRAVKWLGDGVMLWFPDPGSGVTAALGMVADIERDLLLRAHAGLHAGRVVFQEGDFYGNTVNLAARIGDFARPGEVLVSQDVVDLAGLGPSFAFKEVGPVELKGVAGSITLHAASAV